MSPSEEILSSRERAVALLSSYEPLLTATQQKISDDYYKFDLSLSEIASQEKISRAAVSEALKTSIAKMEEFDNKLGLVEHDGILRKRVEEALKIKDEADRLAALELIGKDILHGI
jgi:uncharacterized protein